VTIIDGSNLRFRCDFLVKYTPDWPCAYFEKAVDALPTSGNIFLPMDRNSIERELMEAIREVQELSGHINVHNLENDTQTDKVLISDHFVFFGTEAPVVPKSLLESIGYENRRNYRVFDCPACDALIKWLQTSFRKSFNTVVADPFDFSSSEKRFSVKGNKIT
jgi:hypothetical protein